MTPIPRLAELPIFELPPVVPAALRARVGWRPGRALGPIRLHAAPACSRDGIPLAQHPACRVCGILAGACHPLAPSLSSGVCAECGGGCL